MGFGFNFFVILVLLPLTVILLICWLLTREKIAVQILGVIYLIIALLVAVAWTVDAATSKRELAQKNYYGHYVVKRDYFKGEQADWQYNTFRFEIKKNDSIFFYVTDRDKIVQTYRGTITTTKNYESQRLIINMEQPIHHIMADNPTTYRSTWDFYLVFHSEKFNNVFFEKGKWKPLK